MAREHLRFGRVAFALLWLSAITLGAQAPSSNDKADALSEAARKGDAAAVKKLLDEGVDVNTKFRYGTTALSYACDRGHLEVVKLLLDRGADVNVKDTFYNFTPLMVAVSPPMGKKPAHAEIVGMLLKRGAQGREAALLVVVSMNDAATTKVILDQGNLSADALSDALAAANRTKRQELATLLEQAGAKPRAEFKIDPAQLAKYAGTYRGANFDIIFTVTEGRLTGGPAGQKLTWIPRSETAFGVAEAPGITVTFQIDQGKVTGFLFAQGGNTTLFSRVEGK